MRLGGTEGGEWFLGTACWVLLAAFGLLNLPKEWAPHRYFLQSGCFLQVVRRDFTATWAVFTLAGTVSNEIGSQRTSQHSVAPSLNRWRRDPANVRCLFKRRLFAKSAADVLCMSLSRLPQESHRLIWFFPVSALHSAPSLHTVSHNAL